MIKAVIFDLDGTLYDYDKAHASAVEGLFCEASRLLSIGKNDFADAFEWGKNQVKTRVPTQGACHNRLLYIENALECLGFKPAIHALELYESYWSTFLGNMQLRQGAIELLNYLQGKKIKICLCSDMTAHIQYRKLKKLEIAKYFDFIVTSEEAGVEKPDERIFRLALGKLGLDAREAIFVGDNFERDISGAANAGIQAFIVAQNDDIAELIMRNLHS